MNKTVEIRVSISTDTRVSGRYFIDLRDTTNGADRQMATRVMDAEDALVFIGQAEGQARRAGVTTTVIDQTGGELGLNDAHTEAEEMLAGMTGSRPLLPAVCAVPDCGCAGPAHA